MDSMMFSDTQKDLSGVEQIRDEVLNIIANEQYKTALDFLSFYNLTVIEKAIIDSAIFNRMESKNINDVIFGFDTNGWFCVNLEGQIIGNINY